jgi:ABC-type transport system involved in multi-copper enzyme maturation permease subunit
MTVTDVDTMTTARRPVPPARGESHLRRVLGAEWIKTRSIRSTQWSLVALAVATIGISILACARTSARWSAMPLDQQQSTDVTNLSLNGWYLGQLIVGVLGVLAITSEYGNGMIRTTLAAVPQRRLLLAAKALVLGAVVLGVALVLSFASFLIGQAFLASTGHGASLGNGDVLRAVVGAALYATTIALLGFGLGALFRSTAGAVSGLFGILFLPPVLAEAFSGSWHRTIQRYAPMNAGSRILAVLPSQNALGPWAGMAVLAGYTAVVLVAAFWIVRHRDA